MLSSMLDLAMGFWFPECHYRTCETDSFLPSIVAKIQSAGRIPPHTVIDPDALLRP